MSDSKTKSKNPLLVFLPILENRKCHRSISIGIVLAILIIVYNFIWIDKTYTMSEGWAQFYNGLIDQGKIPYKDFYYYMPFLNLWEDYVLWKLSFGYVLIYRILRLLERVIIIELMYFILQKRISPYIAGIGCFLTCILESASLYDLGGDYNQGSQLWIVLICSLLLKYVDFSKKKNEKYKFLCTIGIGFCGGITVLIKQPLALACGITYLLLLFLLVLLK